jgi:hypothetical protein
VQFGPGKLLPRCPSGVALATPLPRRCSCFPGSNYRCDPGAVPRCSSPHCIRRSSSHPPAWPSAQIAKSGPVETRVPCQFPSHGRIANASATNPSGISQQATVASTISRPGRDTSQRPRPRRGKGLVRNSRKILLDSQKYPTPRTATIALVIPRSAASPSAVAKTSITSEQQTIPTASEYHLGMRPASEITGTTQIHRPISGQIAAGSKDSSSARGTTSPGGPWRSPVRTPSRSRTGSASPT